jgi:hypothetical protein
MASRTLSIRIPDRLYVALGEKARSEGENRSSLATPLLLAGLDLPPPEPPPDGPLVEAIGAAFAELAEAATRLGVRADVELHRTLAVELGRAIERGDQVAQNSRELRAVLDQAGAADDEWLAEHVKVLATPE